MEISIGRVRELLHYEASTGLWTWKVSRQGSRKAGSPAGCSRSDGYIAIKIDQKRVWAHRLAWFYVHGEWPKGQIDHINGNPADNRIENLRDVSSAVNMQNSRRARHVKYGDRKLGAFWNKTWKRWQSSICVNGKPKHLGWFGTEGEAHEAYVSAKRVLHEGCTI